MKKNEFCGQCAFMAGEDHYGYGMCVLCRNKLGERTHCDDNACDKMLDKEELRHATAVLAQYRRFIRAITLDRGNSIPGVAVPLNCDKISDAIEKVTRYINVLTKY